MTEPKYRQREWLYEQYVEEERTITDIADELGVDHTTISKWRRKLDIKKPTKTVELECPVCGSEFNRPQSRVDRAKHANVCSRDCLYEGRSEGIISREVVDGYDTEETVFEKECPSCKDTFTTTATEKYTYCSRECFLNKHSEMMSGESNPSYIDGSSYDKRCYRGDDWGEVRKRVYERDDYTCRRCGVKCVSRRDLTDENSHRLIQAHHIDPYESPEDNELNNLVTLCVSCHAKVENGSKLSVDI